MRFAVLAGLAVLATSPTVARADAATAAELDPRPLVDAACNHKSPPAERACAIARAFAKGEAIRAWPAGDRAWVGHAVEVRFNHGRPVDARVQPFFLRVTLDPKAGRGAFWNAIKPDDDAEARRIDASIATLAAGKPLPAGDALVTFVTTTAPRHGWSPLVPTRGMSLVLKDGDHGTGWLRAVAGHLVALVTDGGDFDNAYATYVELWPVPAK